MTNDVPRLPRSYDESTDWTPDWRNRQAHAYLDAFLAETGWRAGDTPSDEDVRALGGMKPFPDWENDEMVKARAWHLAGLQMPEPWKSAFDFIETCDRPAGATHQASAIKGFLLASRTDEYIAERLGIDPFAVMAFNKILFDVSGLQGRPEILNRILRIGDIADDAPEREKQQRRFLFAGLYCGCDVVKQLLNMKPEMPDAMLKWLAEGRRDTLRDIAREETWPMSLAQDLRSPGSHSSMYAAMARDPER